MVRIHPDPPIQRLRRRRQEIEIVRFLAYGAVNSARSSLKIWKSKDILKLS